MTQVERLEALSGPDRNVDLAISVAVNYKGVFEGFEAKWSAGGDEIEVASHKKYMVRGKPKRNKGYLDPAQFVPRYTDSIDAAMTLVPEGWGRMFNQSENGLHCNVCLARSYPTNAVVYSEAATPAIALCIAALRARSADNG